MRSVVKKVSACEKLRFFPLPPAGWWAVAYPPLLGRDKTPPVDRKYSRRDGDAAARRRASAADKRKGHGSRHGGGRLFACYGHGFLYLGTGQMASSGLHRFFKKAPYG